MTNWGMKIKAETHEEINQIQTENGLRQRINRYALYDSITKQIMRFAQETGLSSEHTALLLAYHALCRCEELTQSLQERIDNTVNPATFLVREGK